MIELCRRLDDVPLALELAAGQLRRFDLDELNRRLDDRLALLSGRRRATRAARHDGDGDRLELPAPRPDRAGACSGTSACSRRRSTSTPSRRRASDCGRPSRSRCSVSWSTRASSCACPARAATGCSRRSGCSPATGSRRPARRPTAFERHRAPRAGPGRRRRRAWTGGCRRASAPQFRTDLDDARQAFRLSLSSGERRRRRRDRHRGVVPVAQRHRVARRATRGSTSCCARELSPDDELWVHILRADVGQGRGDHRQMFGAAAAAEPASSTAPTTRPAPASRRTTARWPTSPTPSQPRRRLGAALELAHQSGDPRLVTLIEAFLAVADLAAGRRRRRPAAALTRLDRVGVGGRLRPLHPPLGGLDARPGRARRGGGPALDGPPAGLPRPHRHRRDLDHVVLDRHVRRHRRRRRPDRCWLAPWPSPTGRATRPTPTACSSSPTPRSAPAGSRRRPSWSARRCTAGSTPPRTTCCTAPCSTGRCAAQLDAETMTAAMRRGRAQAADARWPSTASCGRPVSASASRTTGRPLSRRSRSTRAGGQRAQDHAPGAGHGGTERRPRPDEWERSGRRTGGCTGGCAGGRANHGGDMWGVDGRVLIRGSGDGRFVVEPGERTRPRRSSPS